MHVPSPNEQDYLVWAAERTDAGDVDDTDYYRAVGIAGWTVQSVLDGVLRYGEDSDLEYADLVVQLAARAGVEAPPWPKGVDDPPPEVDLPCELDVEELREERGYDEFYHDDDDEFEDDDEERPHGHVVLPSSSAYRPDSSPGGAVLVDRHAYVVWGDVLWEACPEGELRELVELSDHCTLECAIDSALVFRVGYDYLLYDLETHEFVRRDVDIPIVFEHECGADARTPSGAWTPLSIKANPRTVDMSPCGRFVRVIDRFGKGGIFDVGTWTRVRPAGGPRRVPRLAHEGPKLGGAAMTRGDWSTLLRKLRHRKLPVGLGSGFSFHEGRARWTDNGLTFHDEGTLILVLDEPLRRVSFSVDGREVIGSTDDALYRIDLDAKTIVGRWSTPSRLRYLRSRLPRYQRDEYVEQIVALWQVLGVPNARGNTSALDESTPASASTADEALASGDPSTSQM